MSSAINNLELRDFSATTTTPASVFASHHLCQVLESVSPLVDDLIESVRWPNGSNDDLIASRFEAFEYFVHEWSHWHAELSTGVVAHIVVYFRLWMSALYDEFGDVIKIDILCTGGGEISMTLTDELRSWSRRQRMKVFKAALETQYADRVGAGTYARLEPVLPLFVSTLNTVRTTREAYYMRLVSVFLLMRKGRSFIVRSTKQEKLVSISEWKADESNFVGSARLIWL